MGYWAIAPLSGDPYVQGQLDYLDQALNWAGAAGLSVWIDLHGAPGSQNGFDNSGRRDQLQWQWGDNVGHTRGVITALAQRYAYHPAVGAIQLLNEPLGPALDMGQVKQFWYDGWGEVRDSSQDMPVVIHDAFQPITSWNGFMSTGWNHVVLDTHQYQVFNVDQLRKDIWQHNGAACDIGGQLRQADKWTVVGEWSGARTDCAKYLNGLGIGTRWEGTHKDSNGVLGSCRGLSTGSVSQYSDQQRQESRRFIEAQLDSYEQGAGWIFWTWKTEGAPDWDMHDLIANGVFPQPLTSRKCKPPNSPTASSS